MEHNRTDPCAICFQQALDKVATERGAELISAIEPIVWTNWDTGRASKFIGEVNDERCAEYVNRIADNYLKWHDQVRRLRIEKEAAAWQPLFVQMQKWAHGYLRRKKFPAYGNGRSSHALDCATEAAGRFLTARYPYDVDFHCWVYVLLQNTCLSYMRDQINTTSVPPHKQVELVESTQLHGARAEADEMHFVDTCQDLKRKIKMLSPDRQQFIHLFYYEAKTYAEISVIMDRPINALYKLHHDALKALGKKSGRNGDNNE
jgi:DNA-directed RNA polymerase specialized sigma24 family protein